MSETVEMQMMATLAIKYLDKFSSSRAEGQKRKYGRLKNQLPKICCLRTLILKYRKGNLADLRIDSLTFTS
jgi:hypothetical protein